MNIKSRLLFLIFFLIAVCNRPLAFAQKVIKPDSTSLNRLFTAGYATAFIAGLYDGFYPYQQLKLHGNFGLGAPDKLDGELMILNGKVYQTQSTGKTFEVNEGLCPFAVVNFFKTDREYRLSAEIKKDSLLKFLDKILDNKNGIYAIHIKGSFQQVKTRAFPTVTQKPYAPLALMLDKQQFFSFAPVRGDFIGYRIPGHMEGANITGYHFHFLSEEKDRGGHVIDFTLSDVIIEIDELYNFAVALPKSRDFAEFDFSRDRSDEIKSVETGKK